MKLAVLAVTEGGRELASEIEAGLENCTSIKGDTVSSALRNNWERYDGFICIMAAGITVRSIAPLLKDKKTDPCVLALDEKGIHVISLLSGHLGGGNNLAQRVAEITGGTAVVTTASDTRGLVALDLWAARQNLACERRVMTMASAKLVNSGLLRLCSETSVENLPAGIESVSSLSDADLLISNRLGHEQSILCMYPRNLVVGVGCNRGTPPGEFEEALTELFADLGLSTLSIRNLASIDVKNDETGLLQFAEKNNWPLNFYTRDQINTVTNVSISNAALKAVGAIGVAEPTALLSAESHNLLCRKRKWQNITMAVAEAHFTLSAQVLDPLNT